MAVTTNYGWPKPATREEELEALLQQILDEIDADLYAADSRPRARVYHNANQSLANATGTALALNSERFDTNTMHDPATNNSRLTCQTAGVYLVNGLAVYAAAAGGVRILQIRLNGVTIIADVSVPSAGAVLNTRVEVTTLYSLAATDYLELIGYQDSGGALNVLALGNYSPEFSAVRVG